MVQIVTIWIRLIKEISEIAEEVGLEYVDPVVIIEVSENHSQLYDLAQ
jgi:hypothetical protein